MSLSFFLTSFGEPVWIAVNVFDIDCENDRGTFVQQTLWLVRMIRSLSLLAARPFWGRHCSQFSQGSILGNYSPLCLFRWFPLFFFSDFSPFLYFWNGFTLNFGPVWAGVLFWLLVDPSKFVLFPGSTVECCWMACFLSLCAPVAFRQADILVVVTSSTSAYIYNACNFVPNCALSGLRDTSQVDCQGRTEENE